MVRYHWFWFLQHTHAACLRRGKNLCKSAPIKLFFHMLIWILYKGNFFLYLPSSLSWCPFFPERRSVCMCVYTAIIIWFFQTTPGMWQAAIIRLTLRYKKNDSQPLPYLHTNGRTYSRVVVVVWRCLCRIRCFVLYPGVHPEFLKFKGVASVHQYEVLMRAIRKRKNSRETLIRIRMSRFFCCGVCVCGMRFWCALNRSREEVEGEWVKRTLYLLR